VLDCPAGTVMSRLGRARGKLRRMLQPRIRRIDYGLTKEG
jgi:DNA-directed RNA polymerase specialized sigma24 family protein